MSRTLFGAARRRLARWALGGVALAGLTAAVLPALVMAQAASAAPPSAPDATSWLARIQQAAANSSYQGTLVFNGGGTVSSSRVTHICDGRQRYERLEVLDGRARLQYRHNDQLVTLWPDSKQAAVAQRDAVAEFPALPASAAARAPEHYELRVTGRDRVAGREVDVLQLRPRDRLRFAQRLWADRETGLLLRSDLLGPGGELLESAAFTDVQIGQRPAPEAILRAMKRLDGYRVVKPVVERTQLESEGWVLARTVPGFQLVSCTRRPLEPTASEGALAAPVLQSLFSDGLAQVSLFIEPYDAQRHKQTMGTSIGATHTLTARRGDWWLTVVGEVPMATLQQFEAALERRR